MSRLIGYFKYLVIIGSLQLSIMLYAQDIPIGEWRMHVSYNSVHSLSYTPSKIYAASSNGVMILDKSDNSLSAITKLNGLSSTDITQVAADQLRQQVLITYSDGDVDIIKNNEIINFNRLKNSTTIVGSKRINHISIFGNFAYLSTDFGVVVFDLSKLEIKETFRDLGLAGQSIKVFQSTFYNDSIFLATEKGVLAGDLNDNLLDFSNWRRYNTGTFSGAIQSITTFNNKVFVAVNGVEIYEYSNGIWAAEPYLLNKTYKNLIGGSSFLTITEGNNLWTVNTSNNITAVTSDKLVSPVIAYEDGNGKFWVGDGRNGLVSNYGGSFEAYLPSGPSFSGGLRLKYRLHGKSDVMYALSGGFNSSYAPVQNNNYLNYFSAGLWVSETSYTNENLTDVDFLTPSKVCLSSYGNGLQIINESGSKEFFNNTNSTLTNNKVVAIESADNVLWVAEYGSAKPLHKFNPADNSWTAFSLPYQYPTEIKVDYLGNVWMVQNPSLGGGVVVFSEAANQYAYLSDASGAGGLPSRSVYSIAEDRDGQMWVGTSIGVAYFPDPSRVFSTGLNAVKPIFENRFLLRDEKVTAIEVDGGNRKWMGTERGVWLFDPFGESQVYNFNTLNSPLLSDKIVDVEINKQSGEVFFMTQAGIASFRSDASISKSTFQNVKIFPNPVTANFNGQVGISGLSTDAYIKITDIAGRLIWQSQANGGTAVWNVRDYNGNRASTGIYLVISTSVNGGDSVIGKIAVID